MPDALRASVHQRPPNAAAQQRGAAPPTSAMSLASLFSSSRDLAMPSRLRTCRGGSAGRGGAGRPVSGVLAAASLVPRCERWGETGGLPQGEREGEGTCRRLLHPAPGRGSCQVALCRSRAAAGSWQSHTEDRPGLYAAAAAAAAACAHLCGARRAQILDLVVEPAVALRGVLELRLAALLLQHHLRPGGGVGVGGEGGQGSRQPHACHACQPVAGTGCSAHQAPSPAARLSL
jgi:hypothetical protein